MNNKSEPIFIYKDDELKSTIDALPVGTRIGYVYIQLLENHYHSHLGHQFFMDEMLNKCDITIAIFAVVTPFNKSLSLNKIIEIAEKTSKNLNCDIAYFNTEQLKIPDYLSTKEKPSFIEFFKTFFNISLTNNENKKISTIITIKERTSNRIYNNESKIYTLINNNYKIIRFRGGKDYFIDRIMQINTNLLNSIAYVDEAYYIPQFRLPDSKVPSKLFYRVSNNSQYSHDISNISNLLENSDITSVDELNALIDNEKSIKNFKHFLKNIETGGEPTDQDLLDKHVGLLLFDDDVPPEFIWFGFHPGLIHKRYPYDDKHFFNSTRNAHLFINEKLAENPDFEYVRKAMKERFFNR